MRVAASTQSSTGVLPPSNAIRLPPAPDRAKNSHSEMAITSDVLLVLSLIALFVTKAADFVTTVRHVGPEAERNPLARRWFVRFGFRGGLLMVALVWLAIVTATYIPVWLWGGWLSRLGVAAMGFFTAWAQSDAARFNATGRSTWLTRTMLRWYERSRRHPRGR